MIEYVQRRDFMGLTITDMAGATPEHSAVIVNFVAAIRRQLKNSTCYVFSDNVQYKWQTEDGNTHTVIPDASINCRTKSRKGNTFLDAPRFVMEVLSPSTEKYDRTTKMELYRQQEIEEYWVVDWRKRSVEIYELDYDQGEPKYYLWRTITESNKEELKILHFQNIQISFDDLFDEVNL
jgi:endonuclease